MKLLDNLKLALAGKRVVDLAQKETGFDGWMAAVKVGRSMGTAALAVSAAATLLLLSNPKAVADILTDAGLSPAMSAAGSLVVVGLLKLYRNWHENQEVVRSVVDGKPVDVQAAKSEPVLQSLPQQNAFNRELNRLANDEGMPYEKAIRLALKAVAPGLDVAPDVKAVGP